MIAGQLPGHRHPLQAVLAVVQPLLEAAVVGIQQALVAAQLGRRLRRRVARQVGRRGAGDFLQGEQRPRHQALVLLHAGTDGQVEAVGQQIAVGVGQVQLDAHPRVAAGEVQQQGIEEGLAERHRHGQAHRAGHLVLQAAHRLSRALGLGLQRLGLGQQRGAGGGQVQAPRGAMQQLAAKAALQAADALGQLALAAAQALGGGGETAGLDHQGEGDQVFQLAHGAALIVSI